MNHNFLVQSVFYFNNKNVLKVMQNKLGELTRKKWHVLVTTFSIIGRISPLKIPCVYVTKHRDDFLILTLYCNIAGNSISL